MHCAVKATHYIINQKIKLPFFRHILTWFDLQDLYSSFLSEHVHSQNEMVSTINQNLLPIIVLQNTLILAGSLISAIVNTCF